MFIANPLRMTLLVLPLFLLIGHLPTPALAAYQVHGLGFLGSWYSSVYESSGFAINDGGQVVGKGRSTNGEEAFVWSPYAGLSFLGDLPGGSYQSVAYDINDAGVVVGSSAAATGWRAFVWEQTDGLRALDSLPGFSDCCATAVNDTSPAKIVGYCYSSAAAESCIWDPASGHVIETLGHLPEGFARNYARSINDAGQIVGTSLAADGTSRPFTTFSGSTAGLVELQDMITTPNWTLTEANGINNSGMIVGTGRDPGGRLQAFVLSPAACIPAAERCADAIDNDCDGRSDCDDADCTPCDAARHGVNHLFTSVCCQDGDGDGFAPSGGSCGATDCNDLDAAVHPGAVEVCDGKDNETPILSPPALKAMST